MFQFRQPVFFHVTKYAHTIVTISLTSVLFLLVTACGTTLKHSGTLERHAIIVDKTGEPYLPIAPSPCSSEQDACEDTRLWSTQDEETYLTNAYDAYLEQLIESATSHFPSGKQKKLLFFIHGGLNQQEDSNERASELAKQIKNDTGDEYYPIFVNWDSALFSSYGEHLTSIRQGKTDHWAWATSPTYLATDLGRGILRAPAVWWSLIGNDLTSWPSEKDNWFFHFLDLAKEERDANTIADTLQNDHINKGFPHWLGPQAPSTLWKDQVWGTMTTALTYPIKFLTSPWIDALGTSAWDTMLRRTDILFHTEKEFQADPGHSKAMHLATLGTSAQPSIPPLPPETHEDQNLACKALYEQKQGLSHVKAGGALSIFFRKLAQEIHGDDYPNWSITLVGHSMGAIIVNHILRDFGTCLPIDNIVFMAAASTVNNYKNSVFPFLDMRYKQERAKRLRFERVIRFRGNDEYEAKMPKVYHLMLHELAETSEINYGNLPPTGSLLVWIDNFLSKPLTPMDRTSGRFTNLMLSLHTTPEILRPYISIKRFPGGGSSWGGTRDGIPENHSDFAGRFRFWKSSCWEVPTGKDEVEKFQNEKAKRCFY